MVSTARTWMKLSRGSGEQFWVGIEGDAIVVRRDPGEESYFFEKRLRADDTLSLWARAGWNVEGPFSEPWES